MAWGKQKTEEEILESAMEIYEKSTDIAKGFLDNVRNKNLKTAFNYFKYLKIECKEMQELLQKTIQSRTNQRNRLIQNPDLYVMLKGSERVSNLVWNDANVLFLAKNVSIAWNEMNIPSERIQRALRNSLVH